MDTQMLLSRMERERWDNMELRDERVMAERICEWGRPLGIDGIIRLEISFEVIICDFHSDKLQLVSNITYEDAAGFLGLPPVDGDYIMNNTPSINNSESILQFLGVSAGYDHLKSGESHYYGDPRIELDFRNMVTAINRTYLTPDSYTRRLNNISQQVQDDMIDNIAYALGRSIDPAVGTNWQTISDRIVSRFGPLLATLNNTLSEYTTKRSHSFEDLTSLGLNLTTGTYNIVRRHTNPAIKEENRSGEALASLVHDYSHPIHPLYTEMDVLIWSSIYKVTNQIGEQIFAIFELSKDIISSAYGEKTHGKLSRSWFIEISNRIEKRKRSLISLLNDLNWSYYYQCSEKCQENELCMVPTWGPSPYRKWKTVDENGRRHRVSYSDLQCINIYDL